jgi:tetratricopeptide (TPR) repeat protein
MEQSERICNFLQTALKRTNRPLPLLMAMADLCTRQSRNTEAQDLYREVLQKNSDNTNAMTSLAVLLAQQGIKLDEALKLANQAIEIVGPVGMSLDARARVYLARGETKKALDDIVGALAENESPLWLFHQAQAYDQDGRHDDAAAAMQKALQLPQGLTRELLQPLELASFEKLSRLVRPADASGAVREERVKAPPRLGEGP